MGSPPKNQFEEAAVTNGGYPFCIFCHVSRLCGKRSKMLEEARTNPLPHIWCNLVAAQSLPSQPSYESDALP